MNLARPFKAGIESPFTLPRRVTDALNKTGAAGLDWVGLVICDSPLLHTVVLTNDIGAGLTPISISDSRTSFICQEPHAEVSSRPCNPLKILLLTESRVSRAQDPENVRQTLFSQFYSRNKTP